MKRKFKNLIVIVVASAALFATSCSLNPAEKETITENHYTSAPVPLPTSDIPPTIIPSPHNNPQGKIVIPDLLSALTILVSNDEKIKLSIEVEFIDENKFIIGSLAYKTAVALAEDRDSVVAYITKTAADDYDYALENKMDVWNHTLLSSVTITENSNKYISLIVDYYDYMGGAHGNVTRIPYTFSYTDSKKVELTELINTDTCLKILEEEINRQIKRNIRSGEAGYYEESITLIDEPDFFIRDGKLVVFFQTYEIAPYVMGIPEFEIPPEVFSIK